MEGLVDPLQALEIDPWKPHFEIGDKRLNYEKAI